MKIPLHIDPNDTSREAMRRCWELHAAMMRLNPNGWRKPGKKEGVTKPYRRNFLTEMATHAFSLGGR